MLGCADGDARRHWRDGLVSQVFIDKLRRAPERGRVDTGILSEAGQRGRKNLARDPMQGQGDRIERAGNEIGTRADGFQRSREGVARGTLAVETDGQAARLPQRADQLMGAVRLERARRIVEKDPNGPQLRELLRLFDEVLRFAGVARAVDQAGIELALRSGDRLAGLPKVGDVVQRVMQPEDVDPALGGRGDESAGEISPDRPRADEESAS